MTYAPNFDSFTTRRPTVPNVVGPYSPWPRKPRRIGPKTATIGAIGSLAVFVHCVVPMIA